MKLASLNQGRDGVFSFVDEVALMIDSRRALEIGAAAALVDVPEYVNSWKAPGKEFG